MKKKPILKNIPTVDIDTKVLKSRFKKLQRTTTTHTQKFFVKRLDSVRFSQRFVVFWVSLMVFLILATVFQAIWHQNNYQTKTQAEDGVLAEAVLGPVDTLNPLFANSNAEKVIDRLLFSRLLSYDSTGFLNYDLVKNLTVSEDGLSALVAIKSGVFWHDGQKLTVDDIVFTFELIKSTDLNTTVQGLNDLSVRKVDEATLAFDLKKKTITFTHFLTFPVLPKHILQDVPIANLREASFTNHPIGSGPFKIKYIQSSDKLGRQQIIHLARNSNYYAGTPKLEKLQLHVYDDSSFIQEALDSAEVNATAELSLDEIASSADRYQVISAKTQAGYFALLNTTSPMLKDINVRKALQLSVDRASIINELRVKLPLLDLPLTNFHLPGNQLKADDYNLEKAKQLLDESGWKVCANGIRCKESQELQLSAVSMTNRNLERLSDFVLKQWGNLGIRVNFKVVDTNDASQDAIRSILQPRAYDVLFDEIVIGADPDVYARWHSSQTEASGLNFANYNSSVADDALSTARLKSDKTLRVNKYQIFVQQWLKDVPAIGLFQSTVQYVVSKNIQAFSANEDLISPFDRYGDIVNWSVGETTVFKTP